MQTEAKDLLTFDSSSTFDAKTTAQFLSLKKADVARIVSDRQTHLSKSGRTPRRKFTPEFKARIVKLCEQPGAVASKIAREHRLGSYLVNRWVREHRARETPSFVPVHVAEPVASIAEIRIECTRGQHQVCIAWPASASAARECVQWLRD